ncbi:PAS domain S-box protein [Terrihabitans sp. B22-R8]|uniref:PAS domain S-box protein n=1 Tax=Terrihabitans sp. B22-R8 TaxID=3425128 RepID=UPI00403CBB46
MAHDTAVTSSPYELLIQHVIDHAIYMLSPDGTVASWNPGAERIKGYKADEIIGAHFSDFYTAEDRAVGKPQEALRIAATDGRFSNEGWRIRKDGSRFWALAVIDAIYEEGSLIGFVKITRDITIQREAHLALVESERRFRFLVQGVIDYAIYMLDPTGHITNWNTGAERIKGYKASDIIGQHFSVFYTAEDRARGTPENGLEQALREGRFEAEGWRQRQDGTRFWASVVIDAIRDETGDLIGFAKVTRDVTERRMTQERLEQSREQLFQAQKMEALGQLTGGIAHDFNNLLTAILGGAELALRHSGDSEKLHRLLEGIRASAQRGGSLTKQLLAFARRQVLEAETIDLLQQLPATADLLRHSLTPNVSLSTEFPEELWTIEADPGQLELAILNLGINGRDAMPDGGQLTLRACNVVLAGEVDNLHGEFVAISMSDEGTGIAPEIRQRIFEPFFTTKSFGKGTGLGLSQTYGFVQQSKGALGLESQLDVGTTITIYLPRKGSEIRQDQGVSIVLLVEDDPHIAELTAELVRDIGYEPKIASSGNEALAILARTSGVRLLFTDLVLPGGMSGIELARKTRTRFPEMPVLLTSGYSDAMTACSGEFPLLTKPYSLQQLSDKIKSLLAPTN